MQEEIKIEEMSSTEQKILISVPAAVVDKKFDEFFANIKDKAQVPGFRAGKAPIQVLKQHFYQKAKAPVAAILIQEYYDKAIRDNGINPIGNPNIKDFTKTSEFPGSFGFDGAYMAEMTVEIIPKIDPIGYTELELNMFDIDENEIVKHHISEYQNQFSTKIQITDRGANLGDTLIMDFVGSVDGTIFEGGSAKGYSLEHLGGGSFIPGFEEQLVGIKAEESKKISVTFPTEYHAKHLAGKNATFDVTVQKIILSTLAEENDELAIMAGFTSLTEMKEKLQTSAKKEKHLLVHQRMHQQIMSKILDVNKFDVPKSLIENELQHLKSRVDPNQLSDKIMQELRKNAEANVRGNILVNAIYEKEPTTEVTPEELSEMLDEHAAKSGKTKDELISALYNSKQMDNFVGILRFSKVIDFIIDNAKQQKESEEVK